MNEIVRFRIMITSISRLQQMSYPVESPTRVAFGLYEADLLTGELWKAGHRVKIQSQPFKVLSALVERPGEVVTREELQLRLWGKDTIVDFDHSLGTAINKIREALGDSAENPRFVETLARRGYRFIAPVTFPAASAFSSSQSATAPAVLSSIATTAARALHLPRAASSSSRALSRWQSLQPLSAASILAPPALRAILFESPK
jgi:DNA-binding winged helix-turn-helix (wHTH) protein